MNHLVSFSGGKDSLAMLLMMLERNMPVDEIVFFDTGWEWPQIVETVKDVELFIGRKITHLRPPESFEWWMYEKPCAIGNGKGFPRFNLRWCTGLKQSVTKQFMKNKKPYINYIGITADERYRVVNKPKSNAAYPLIEWGITEKECLRYCKQKGFTFGNLYQYMSSISCWCCPLQPLNALRGLYKNYPEMWQKLLEMQHKTKTPFKIGQRVKDGIFVDDIDARFKKEIASGTFEKHLRKYQGEKQQVSLYSFQMGCVFPALVCNSPAKKETQQ